MKKTVAIITALMLLLPIAASANEIYSYTTQKTMTNGVTIKNIQRFYSDYSLNINLVEADLKNEFLSLELLKDPKGVDKLSTTLNLAKGKEGVVAATNCDFFASYKGDQNFSLGIEIKDGTILQSHINSDMAAGFVKDNALSLSYITMDASVKAQNGSVLKITHINKPTDYYGALLMYTSAFNGAVSPFLPVGVTAVTITDGVVTGKGVSMGGTIPIPQNGYILVIDDNMTPMLDINVNVGDAVELNVSANPSIKDVTTAFGGGTLLLKDGQKTKITHNVTGNNPRTAIGTNADGTVIYMLTVDGRQTISRGVSLEVLADLCLEFGMVNAINLDGGGSTALVGKTTDEPDLHVLNSPSENRKVINGVSVVSSAKPGKAQSFEVKVFNNCVLVGDSIEIYVNALDENKNAAASILGSLTWVVSKGSGKVENNVFYPEAPGEAVIELYYDNILQSTQTFNVLGVEDVSGIDVQPAYSVKKAATLDSKSIAKVFDKDGNHASINNISLLNPDYDRSFLKVDNSKIEVLKEGAGTITLSLGSVVRYIKLLSDGYKLDTNDPITLDSLLNNADGKNKFNIIANAPHQTFFNRLVYARAMDTFRTADAVAVLGKTISMLTPQGTTPITGGSFNEHKIKNGHVITLGLSTASSFRTNGQWGKLSESLKKASENNIFILMNENFYLKDALENKVFHDMLSDVAKNKNVFVIYNGTENSVRLYKGVRYISVADANDYSNTKASIQRTKYLSFNLEQTDATYCFKNIY